VWKWLDISSVSPGVIRDHYTRFIHMAGLPRLTHSTLKVIWLAFVWELWKERNNRVFKNAASDPHNILDRVKLTSFLWLKANQVSFVFYYHDWSQHPLLCMGVPM
jgi:hypothetical protein